MTLKEGDQLPQISLTIMGDNGPEPLSTKDIFENKKVVIFAVPGAFTPTCHQNHLPGYKDNVQAFKTKGIDTIAVISVNDVFVMNAWEEQSKTNGNILFLADGAAAFTKAVGMDLDLSEFGMGIRSKRYAMIVEDGTVKKLNIEDIPSEAKSSSASSLLSEL